MALVSSLRHSVATLSERSSQPKRPPLWKPAKKSVAVALQSMAVMLEAGVPLTQAFEAVRAQVEEPDLIRILDDLDRRVTRQGWRFSQALKCHPGAFPAYCPLLIRAAELGGDLAGRVREAGQLMEREVEMSGRIRAALVAPCLTLATALVILFGCVKFVMPRFAEMYAGLEMSLPWITRVVIASVTVANHWLFLLALALSAAALYRWRGRLRQALFTRLIGVPPFRNWLGTVLAAQFCDILGSLIRQGVPLTQGVRMIADNAAYTSHRQQLLRVHARLLEDGDFAAALRLVPYFPKVLTTVAVVGEEVGTLEQLLGSLSQILQQEVDLHLTSAVRLLEPALICLLGALTAFFFVGMFMPVYGMIQNLA